MYKRILVPLDGSGLAECALPHVKALAGLSPAPEVVFVRVIEPAETALAPVEGMSPQVMREAIQKAEDAFKRAKDAAKGYLDKIVARFKADGNKLSAEVLEGRAADILAEYADKNGFDLIVIATHGRSGVSRWVWGSTADRILHSAHIPVLMVRAPGSKPPR